MPQYAWELPSRTCDEIDCEWDSHCDYWRSVRDGEWVTH